MGKTNREDRWVEKEGEKRVCGTEKGQRREEQGGGRETKHGAIKRKKEEEGINKEEVVAER